MHHAETVSNISDVEFDVTEYPTCVAPGRVLWVLKAEWGLDPARLLFARWMFRTGRMQS